MGCFKHCRKWTILSFNFLFLIVGAGLIIVGALSLTSLNDLNEAIPSSYDYLITTPVILLVIGSIIVVISVLGSIGVLKKNLFLLNTLTIALIVIFVLQILISVATFWTVSNQSDLAISVNNTVADVFKNHSTNMEVVDFMQSKLHCCGPQGPKFWSNETEPAFPKSCCDGGDCSAGIYDKGCQNALYDFLLLTVRVVGITLLVLAPLLVIGATLALNLANGIRNDIRRYGKYVK